MSNRGEIAARGTGTSPAIPVSIDDVDAAWLTAALSTCPGAPTVRSFTVAPIGVGVGLMGLLYRLSIEYRGDRGDAPPTVIVKLPVLIEATRQVSRAYRFYEKEVAFYRDLAADTPLRTAEIYFGSHDPETDDFVLVMEDLGHLRASDQIDGCAPADAVAAVVAIARHHAAFWNDERFDTEELAWLPFGSDAPTPEGIAQALGAYWEPFVAFMGADLEPAVKAVGEWLPGATRDLLTIPDGHAVTLAHGDYRLDNLLFDDERAVSALDWQIATKSVGGYDFAYFVSQSLSAAARRRDWDALFTAYLGALAEAGVAYPEAEFWADIRRTLLFCLVYPVQCMALDLTDPRAAALVREMADRASSAILELGALEHFPG